MSLISVDNLYKAYANNMVLEGISFQVQAGNKIGLIGPNGCGKSTLLKILAGELEADGGKVYISSGSTTAYLPQEPRPPEGGTLRSLLEKPLKYLFDMKDEITRLEQELSRLSRESNNSTQIQKMLDRYGELTEHFDNLGGYQVEGRVKSVASGVGFLPEDMDKDISKFSGGEITRANLASLLLQEPDFLLLDEPTNFLDINALEWLEKYLKEWSKSLIIVSHDRFFLDRVVSQVFLLKNKSIKCYSGNYSSFVKQKKLEDLEHERQHRKQQAKIEREKTLIRESKGDERSKRQAKSRQKRLEKMSTVERPGKQESFTPGFAFVNKSSRVVVSFQEVSKQYPSKTLFRNLSFKILWGDRVALVGANGSGKTTLLKLIAGEENPTEGNIHLGYSVKVAYFSQEQEQLNLENSILEEIVHAGDMDYRKARNHLGRYLFQGEEVFKKVKVLSSGEKSRLALAKLSLVEGNCLLMDEPTSHLDLPALEELEDALQNYPGTLVIVSHDRYFLSVLANRVMEIDKGKVHFFQGSYQEYLQYKAEKDKAAALQEETKKKERQKENKQHRQVKEKQERIKKLHKRQEELESHITSDEEEIDILEKKLSDPGSYGDYRQLQELNEKLQEAREKASSHLKEWEEVSQILEEIQNDPGLPDK